MQQQHNLGAILFERESGPSGAPLPVKKMMTDSVKRVVVEYNDDDEPSYHSLLLRIRLYPTTRTVQQQQLGCVCIVQLSRPSTAVVRMKYF
jgi:hypothetical protein